MILISMIRVKNFFMFKKSLKFIVYWQDCYLICLQQIQKFKLSVQI